MRCFIFIFLCGYVAVFAQDSELLHAQEKGYNPEYRLNYFDKMIFQVDVYSNTDNFYIPKLNYTNNENSSFKPKDVIKMRFSFDYKFLGLNFAISPNFISQNKSDPTKGDTKTLDLSFKFFYSDRLRQEVVYRTIKGFYLENADIKQPVEIFENLEIQTIGGKTFFILNRNFSYRAFESMTERQLKSCGSFVPAISYYYNDLKTNKQNAKETYLKEIESYDAFVQAGYMYNFVLASKWFATVGVHPGIGINTSKNYYENPLTQEISKQCALNVNYNIDINSAIGYNNKSFFSGLRFNYKNLEYNNSNTTEIINSKWSFGVFAGYRFNEVKQIKKAFNYIEKKLGI
jgi:Domain of unknown function (DUF4421)